MRTHTRRFGIVLLSAAMLVPVGCAGHNNMVGTGAGAALGAGIAALAGGDATTMLAGGALGGLLGNVAGTEYDKAEEEEKKAKAEKDKDDEKAEQNTTGDSSK